jgi:hypothetical protein
VLDQRRPHPADAARNFDAILTAAREDCTDSGIEASLEDIARRAGVGPATLYRNFPREKTSSRPSTSPRSTRCAKTPFGWPRQKNRSRPWSLGYDTS